MKPGDILYLPRGQYHDALTGAQASLHITFGVSPATGLALFKLLESAASQESAFRAYLPDARNEAALRERLGKLAERVRAMITSPAFAIDVLNHQRGLASASRQPTTCPRSSRPPGIRSRDRAQVVRRDSGLRRRLRARRDRAGRCLPDGRMAAQAADVLAGRRALPPAGRRSGGASWRACSSSSPPVSSSRRRCGRTADQLVDHMRIRFCRTTSSRTRFSHCIVWPSRAAISLSS